MMKKMKQLHDSAKKGGECIFFSLDEFIDAPRYKEGYEEIKIEISMQMLKENFDDETIIRLTKISKRKLAKLKQDLSQKGLNCLHKRNEKPERKLGQLYDFAENGDEYLFYNKEEFKKSVSYDEGREDSCDEIVLRMLKENFDDDTIMKLTNISKEKLLKLRKKLSKED